MDAAAAQSKVQGPGIALIVYGVLQILFSCCVSLANILSLVSGASAEMAEVYSLMGPAAGLISGGGGLVMAVPALLISCVIVFGGVKMKKLQSHSMAMAGAVCAMLPCSGCCCIGLGIGIWALMTLMNDEVKAAFQANAAASM